MVDLGLEGAQQRVLAHAVRARRSEPRLETVATLRSLAQRSEDKLESYYAHMVRAAHEARTMSRLLDELEDDGCIVVADWKMKFLMSLFREAMSEFFGKKGIPWHGCMIMRCPLRFEQGTGPGEYGKGEFVCECDTCHN